MFEHFLTAQERMYPVVLRELAAGEKQSHWMWFIFPQLRSLGRSAIAQKYGLEDLSEALAYRRHPILGARLRECICLANAVQGRTALEIFGPIDALKFRSCLTLFLRASGDPIFLEGIDKFYAGEEDPLTVTQI